MLQLILPVPPALWWQHLTQMGPGSVQLSVTGARFAKAKSCTKAAGAPRAPRPPRVPTRANPAGGGCREHRRARGVTGEPGGDASVPCGPAGSSAAQRGLAERAERGDVLAAGQRCPPSGPRERRGAGAGHPPEPRHRAPCGNGTRLRRADRKPQRPDPANWGSAETPKPFTRRPGGVSHGGGLR